MKNLRPRKVILFCGMRFTGKTTKILELIEAQKQRVLIFDINREEKYDKINSIGFEEIPKFTGVKKIFSPKTKLCEKIFSKYLRNSLLVLEDANRYLSTSKEAHPDLWAMLVSLRHMGLDIVLTFHSLARVPPFILEMTNTLVLFKTSENPDRVRDKIPNYELVKKRWEIINADKDPHHYEIINLI